MHYASPAHVPPPLTNLPPLSHWKSTGIINMTIESAITLALTPIYRKLPFNVPDKTVQHLPHYARVTIANLASIHR
jgi:hypothetical protein